MENQPDYVIFTNDHFMKMQAMPDCPAISEMKGTLKTRFLNMFPKFSSLKTYNLSNEAERNIAISELEK